MNRALLCKSPDSFPDKKRKVPILLEKKSEITAKKRRIPDPEWKYKLTSLTLTPPNFI
tara:strand:+ start:434 stop:607 length:174 start_codon:yes stop_codon:yes gene_type:complete